MSASKERGIELTIDFTRFQRKQVEILTTDEGFTEP